MTSEQLRQYRKLLKFTQIKLAEELGISSNFVSLMERGVKPIERRTDLAVRMLMTARGIVW